MFSGVIAVAVDIRFCLETPRPRPRLFFVTDSVACRTFRFG